MALRRLRLIEFDFRAFDRLGAHDRAADAISLHPGASLEEWEGSEADFDDDISMYYILKRVSDVENISQEESWMPLDVANTADLGDAQQTDAFCQYATELFAADPVWPLMIKDWFAEKHLSTARYK